MSAIPTIFLHEEDFVWQVFFVPAEFTVKQAADFLMSLIVNATVWPKNKEVRIVKYYSGEVLDPNAKFGEVVKPGEPLLLVWWPPKEEWWRKKDDETFRLVRETEELMRTKAPRSPMNIYREEFERLSIIRRLEREGKI
ncbi:toluene-4-monooxygenase system B family protein [Pyrobaculum aerophilum]|uniref:Uncharacterized protein n=1 Tax=Pyrobaculum aerophilum TaxID=13773 RepID=A0A371R5N1_9CREN|nr:toluene-4-monooxygenase system B family protein [Pyrobaculum aerophilum]RFA97606.1 hypothetical protein CGL51_02840 [Pyrobaculum aerophilum]RFA99373.1 hypothetical protein CGL52_04025 [Pyrobaculum aerophilum]